MRDDQCSSRVDFNTTTQQQLSEGEIRWQSQIIELELFKV